MNTTRLIQYALICLETLEQQDGTGHTAETLSREQGIPLDVCCDVMHRLEDHGLVRMDNNGVYRLEQPLAEYTAWDILQALEPRAPSQPTFQLMFGSSRGQWLRTTLHAAGRIGQPLPVMEG